ncbi:DUF551 domain-containing protein [Citrobacter freundii]|nr:DUF551 domain-containing protein [Citrobacter freundii]MCW1446953.1 DUF551 domain-containing protein [Citrobacter freundii]
MTTNHPAHGPVSLDRLHQISEILSKAAAQSDGGNLGYEMADAVKVIDVAIASFGAEPVGITDRNEIECLKRGEMANVMPPDYKGVDKGDEVYIYTAPPVTGVPDEMYWQDAPVEGSTRAAAYATGWNACRSAMLQAGNSPVTPDGWIPVSDRMPDQYVEVIVCTAAGSRYIAALNRQMNFDDGDFFDDIQDVTHWIPLPAAPQQEVKNV